MDNKKAMYERINGIASLMLGKASSKNSGENIVLSPVSLIFALALAFDAADGTTKDQIRNFLCKEVSEEDLDALISSIQKDFSYTQSIRSANAVISTIDIKPEFKDAIRSNYRAECISEDKGALVDRVNTWVNRKTSGMIPRLLDESTTLDVCLINAITFIAEWDEKYEDYDVHKNVSFTPFNGKVEKGAFLQSYEESYIETGSCTGFSKKYKGEEFEFVALLPKEEKESGLGNLLAGLDFKNVFEAKTAATVLVKMPEFKMEYGDELSEFCKENGIKEMFNKTADFSNMTDVIPTYIDKIIQKAYIMVDRNGTRAAAATAEVVCAGGLPPDEIKTVVLNRPFVYAIIHAKTGIPVFTGIVNHIK